MNLPSEGQPLDRRIAACLLFFLVLQCAAIPLFSQGSIGDTTGTLSGDVKDEAGTALPGVVIIITGASGTKTETTDKDGKFIFPYLTPGIYTARAELKGFTTIEQDDIQIRLGQRSEISFKMKLDIHESVNVSAETSVIDPTSTTVVTNVTDQLTKRIPIGRNLRDIILLAPGVVDDGSQGNNLSISGASGMENTYIIDGVNVTEPSAGTMGSISGIHGLMVGNGLPINTIQEVQIQTASFEPEYGESLGGTIHVITKRGGNNYHGSLYVYSRPQDSDDLIRGGYNGDAGGEIGGPILKNKLFFYTAYCLTRSRSIYDNDPSYPSFAALPTYTNETISNSYSVKATADLTSKQTLEFSASGDPGYRPFGNQDGYLLEQAVDPKQFVSEWHWGTSTQVLRWSGTLGQNTFYEVQAGRAHSGFTETPADKKLPRIINEDGLEIGGFGGVRNFLGNNLQYSAKFTNLWKNHQFRYGIEFQNISFSQTFLKTGGNLTLSNGQVATNGYIVFVEGVQTYKVFAILSPAKSPTTTKYADWFVQDSWALTRNLNLGLGVRWEQQQYRGDLPGAARLTFGNNWAPRIGLTYDYLKNGKSKAFFHYGRFYQKVPNYMAILLNGEVTAIETYKDINLTEFDSGTIENDSAQIEGFGQFQSSFRPSAPYTNEWVVGSEQELNSGITFGVRFISRNTQNTVSPILVNPDAPCVQLPAGGCMPTSLTVEDVANGASFNELFTNVDGHIAGHPALIRNYKAIEFTAEKRWKDRWQMLGSYTYSQLVGNFEEVDPLGLDANFAESPLTQYNYEKGPLQNDFRHVVKLFGSYQWTGHLNTGFAFNFQTGHPITKLGIFVPDGFERQILLSPRGVFGRTDPTATLDAHADYMVNISGNHRITFGFDVFNLFAHETSDVDQTAVNFSGDLTPEPSGNFLNKTKIELPRTVRLDFTYAF